MKKINSLGFVEFWSVIALDLRNDKFNLWLKSINLCNPAAKYYYNPETETRILTSKIKAFQLPS